MMILDFPRQWAILGGGTGKLPEFGRWEEKDLGLLRLEHRARLLVTLRKYHGMMVARSNMSRPHWLDP